MWLIFLSRLIFSLIAIVAIIFILGPFLAKLLMMIGIPTSITFNALTLIILTIALFRFSSQLNDDMPSLWNQMVEFNFEEKKLRINDRLHHFNEIQKIIANEYDSDLFSSYYKIWLIDKNGKKTKVLSLKNPNEYSRILRALKEEGLLIN